MTLRSAGQAAYESWQERFGTADDPPWPMLPAQTRMWWDEIACDVLDWGKDDDRTITR